MTERGRGPRPEEQIRKLLYSRVAPVLGGCGVCGLCLWPLYVTMAKSIPSGAAAATRERAQGEVVTVSQLPQWPASGANGAGR